MKMTKSTKGRMRDARRSVHGKNIKKQFTVNAAGDGGVCGGCIGLSNEYAADPILCYVLNEKFDMPCYISDKNGFMAVYVIEGDE